MFRRISRPSGASAGTPSADAPGFAAARPPLWPLVLLVAVLAAVYLVCAGPRDFWYPDEPDLAIVTQNILTTGNWLDLRLNEASFADYPPLYFWLSAAAATVGGTEELVMRLPSLLAAIGLLAAMGVWVRRRMGSTAALWATAVLGTTYLFVWQAVNLQVDMLFTCLIAVSLFLWDLSRDAGTRRLQALLMLLAGAAMGLASLTKGPAGIVLPVGIAALDAGLHREWRALPRLAAAGLTASVIFLAWSLAYANATGAQNLLYFILQQNVGRFLRGWSHNRPVYYHFVNMLPDMLPWSFLLVPALAAAWRAARARDRAQAFALLWFAVVLLFFTASRSKRGVYILPLYPAAGVMVGSLVTRLTAASATRPRWLKALLWAWAGLFVAGGVSAAVAPAVLTALFERTRNLEAPAIFLALLLLSGAAYTAHALMSKREEKVLRVLPAVLTAVYLLGFGWMLGRLDHPLSAKDDVRWLRRQYGPGDVIGVFRRTEKLPKEASAIAFYSGLRMEPLDSVEDVADYVRFHPDTPILVKEEDAERLRAVLSGRWKVVHKLRVGSDVFLAFLSPHPSG